MSLFRKKKEEKKQILCACCENNNKEMNIKVLGMGCDSCHKMFENAKVAVENKGIDIEVEYVTDLKKITEYGVMTVPALVVNDKVVSMGKALKADEIEKFI